MADKKLDNSLEGTSKTENAETVKLGAIIRYHVLQKTDRGHVGRKGSFDSREEADAMVETLKSVYEDRVYEVVPSA